MAASLRHVRFSPQPIGMRAPSISCSFRTAPSRPSACSAEPSRERVAHITRVAQASLASCAAVALMISDPAGAISGGKQSVGIFKPLDDADLSGQDLRTTQFIKGSLRRVKFDGANLSGTSMFGSFCKGCSFVGADLRNTSLESADLEEADFSNALMEGALVTNVQFKANNIDSSDWTDVLLRKDQQKYLCSIASGTNPTTGVDTRESLGCP